MTKVGSTKKQISLPQAKGSWARAYKSYTENALCL